MYGANKIAQLLGEGGDLLSPMYGANSLDYQVVYREKLLSPMYGANSVIAVITSSS